MDTKQYVGVIPMSQTHIPTGNPVSPYGLAIGRPPAVGCDDLFPEPALPSLLPQMLATL